MKFLHIALGIAALGGIYFFFIRKKGNKQDNVPVPQIKPKRVKLRKMQMAPSPFLRPSNTDNTVPPQHIQEQILYYPEDSQPSILMSPLEEAQRKRSEMQRIAQFPTVVAEG